jgi:gas vesicle protein
MSQREGFTGGFIAGAILGSFMGAVAGTLLAGQRLPQGRSNSSLLPENNTSDPKVRKGKKRQLQQSDADSIEMSRRGLEDKIAQLNDAIDEVRLSLGNVNSQNLATETEAEPHASSDASKRTPQS